MRGSMGTVGDGCGQRFLFFWGYFFLIFVVFLFFWLLGMRCVLLWFCSEFIVFCVA